MKKYILIAVIVIAAIVVLMMADRLIETNQDGHYQVKQAWISGDMSVRAQSGTYSQGLGTIWTYKNVATVRFGEGDDGGGEASAELNAIPVIFSDGSKGLISGLVRVRLPVTDQERKLLKNEFAEGYKHFIESGLKPVINNAIKLAANLRTAQDAYTTLAQFQFAISDQLEYGMYMTEAVTKTITRETGDTEEVKVTEILYDEKTGLPLRQTSRLLELGAFVTECVIEVPEFDTLVESMIAKRKTEAMKTELAKQEAIRAKQDAITAEQQGLANVAKAKYIKEVELIKDVTDARKIFEVSEFAALTALETAKKIEAEGRANALANKLLVAAGLTPVQEMNMRIEIADKVSANLSKAQMPKIFIAGGDGGGAGASPLNAVGIKFLMDIMNDLEKK